MECTYNKDDICTNDQCPMHKDYCPVPSVGGVCQYEQREDEDYTLSPKGCLAAAFHSQNIYDDDLLDDVWTEFADLMIKHGYAEMEED